MAEIFLSYRRDDSQSATGRLAERLSEHFGEERVFRDHESIVAGEDFAAAITRAIEASTVVLAIIGRDWLTIAHPDGRRRLDDPQDFVRLELESALAAGIDIVPVLVEGAGMPASHTLPTSLQAFARCQAVELSERRWPYDADALMRTLTERFAIDSVAPLPDAPAGGGLAERAARQAYDLLDLMTRPTRLIARRQTGRAVDHLRAFLFLVIALFVGNWVMLVGLNVTPTPASVGGALGGLLGWLMAGELLGLMATTMLAVALTLGWRLVGVAVPFRRVTPILAYVVGGAWLGATGGVMLFGLGLALVDATVFDRALLLLRGPGGGEIVPFAIRQQQAGVVLQAALQGPALMGLPFAAITWLVTAGWVVVAWGAFRQAFLVPRWRAWAATAAAALLLGALAATAGWLG